MGIEAILSLCIFASWIYWAVALISTWAFWREKEEIDPNFTPPVSVLKPIKGLDYGAYLNFKSFFTQDYPSYEILFGVESPDEPTLPVIKRLMEEYPHVPVKIVMAEPQSANRKAGMLEILSAHASNPILVISDSDFRVPADYLRRIVSPLKRPEIGLVTSFYRGKEALTTAAKVEALYISTNLLPSASIGLRWLKMGYAFGSTIALWSKTLEEIGGFKAFADYLADDHEAGARVRATGKFVHLSRCIVDTTLGPVRWRELWSRQLRWMRCVQVSRPYLYPEIVLTFSIPLSLLLGFLTDFSFFSRAVLLMSLGIRLLVGWLALGFMDYGEMRRNILLLPLGDLLQFALWLWSPFSRKIVWRGEEYWLKRDGRIERLERKKRRMPFSLLWWRRR
ncbi:MAG: bacteriohopanetetrol glucosamine biosynthesis glycosyltransferase HpnI [Anaerolineae bacterium]|nr:bacteriohopanetetrol glucosamine biosynthesis glycosyltransferase HpnI [Anaerolineae bacterium]MDW8102151.1 bacteriohopanetetrol glucosamine biosynthesis glycosyltransferase HpnI [Anaerolineae bacterium]